ncbi:MAG: 1-acyl-sn-glycerol-3-phosphate acyltransferase [Rubricoccaceae bacterium]|nr:1-acyl-sn-glycerol-3-phosphate acyltransferase [Rubricoccaceae bacterium]
MPARPPFVYRALVGLVRFVVRVFFGEVAVEGREHVPRDRGGLLVAWHPNGLIDPALILATFPGRIVFGARDGLLRWPLLGRLFRALGTVPIYRPSDTAGMTDEARRALNARSLDALAAELAAGSFAALFPEGRSHDLPHVAELKTGAARLFHRASALADEGPRPAIVPVGLHYDRKDLFLSDVLVAYHPPLDLPPDLLLHPGETDDEAHERARRLTDAIEHALVHVVRATDDWHLHTLMHRARTLLRAEAAARTGARPDRDSVAERALGFAQVWHGYRVRRETHADEIEPLRADLTRYHRLLRALRLEDADLDDAPRRSGLAALAGLTLRALAVFVLLPPLLLVGYVVNGPVHLLMRAAARRFSTAPKDVATVKILVGFLLYPLAWLGVGVATALLWPRLHALVPALPDLPLLAGLVAALLAFASGVLVVNYVALARETARAVRARLAHRRRRDVVAALRRTRADLHDRFVALGEGLDLPDDVTDLGVAAGDG